MTLPIFDPDRAAALREALIARVDRPARRFRWWHGVAAFAVAGALTGGTVSATAATLFNRVDPTPPETSEGSAIAAPPGVSPGAPIISMLGEAMTRTVEGDAVVSLTPPEGATHVRVSIICLTAGTTYWGTDPGGNNPSIECTTDDVRDPASTGYSFPIEKGTTLYTNADARVKSLLSIQFIAQIPTAWGVNAQGETYGVPKAGVGEPDLILASGEDAFGQPVDGYVRAEDLQGEAPRDIPLFTSDGTTQVGVFHLGAGSAP
jgi:hypothetical protein